MKPLLLLSALWLATPVPSLAQPIDRATQLSPQPLQVLSAFESDRFLLARLQRATHGLGTGEFPRAFFVPLPHLPGEALAFVLDLIQRRGSQR